MARMASEHAESTTIPWESFRTWEDAFKWETTATTPTNQGPEWVGAHCQPGCRPNHHRDLCEWYAFGGPECTDGELCEEAHRERQTDPAA